MRAAFSGSWSAIHPTFEAVNAATKSDPVALDIALAPPQSELRSVAACAERVSFHKSAGRTTSPLASSATIPCCCPPIEIAATSSNPPASIIALSNASFQCAGLISVPSGCAARPSRSNFPLSAWRITTLTDCVEESTPATNFSDMAQG
ncbi:unannotated protein [freshwater metagenome]|uniref:Unannotated protein n=1 Tax=freshwater metagenome TaxID=449393 RepID=A0A6J6DUN4_9ZZZZ